MRKTQKHKTIPRPCRRAEKRRMACRKTQHVRGRTRPARPRFCVFAFMYFVPRRLSCGTAEETGVPRGARRLPRSDNVWSGRRTAPPGKKTPPAARGRKILCVKSRVCHASLFRRCRRVLPAWCRPPGTPAVGAPPNLSMPPASAHCRKRVISHPRHPSWRWASHGEAALPAPLLQKGPALHSCMEYQTSRCCKAGAPRLSAFSSALPESGRSTGR